MKAIDDHVSLGQEGRILEGLYEDFKTLPII